MPELAMSDDFYMLQSSLVREKLLQRKGQPDY